MKKKVFICAMLIAFLPVLLVSADRGYTPAKSNVISALWTDIDMMQEKSDVAQIVQEFYSDVETAEDILQKRAADTDVECFAYEELADGTLRITGYDERVNMGNTYQVTVPAFIDGKAVSVLGEGCLGSEESYTWDLIELTISEGITTLESELLENVSYDLCLVNIPDSVVSIAANAFQDRNSEPGDNAGVAIGCSESSYAYEYALENGLACRILDPVLPENAFLSEYPISYTGLPYYCHYRMPGKMFDYIVVEYLDTEIERKMMGETIYTDANEFMVLVLEKDTGEILQCLDSSYIDPDYVNFSRLNGVFYDSFLSLADWNFDGIEDLLCDQGYFGTGAASFSKLFVYDSDNACYVSAPGFGGIDTPQLREDKKCIYGFSRGAAYLHYVDRYEYIDGELCHVARLTEKWTEEGLEITDERLLDGEWQIYRQETFSAQSDYTDDTYEDVIYKQAEVLFVNDGYWDL